MSTVYDWRAEGDFPASAAPSPDAVRRALVDVASGRLPSLATLARAVGIDSTRALAVRDHLAHLLAERDVCGRTAEAAAETVEHTGGTAGRAVDEGEHTGAVAEAAEAAAGEPGAPAPITPPPARTAESAPALPAVPDPVCPRALDVFAADLAEGRTPSLRGIMRTLHVGSPRAKRIRGFLAAHVRSAA
jgi:hypothetical protein